VKKNTRKNTFEHKTYVIIVSVFSYEIYLLDKGVANKHVFSNGETSQHLSFSYKRFGSLELKLNQVIEVANHKKLFSIYDIIHLFGHRVDKSLYFKIFIENLKNEVEIKKNDRVIVSMDGDIVDKLTMRDVFKIVFNNSIDVLLVSSTLTMEKIITFLMYKKDQNIFFATSSYIYIGVVCEDFFQVSGIPIAGTINQMKDKWLGKLEINEEIAIALADEYSINQFREGIFLSRNSNYLIDESVMLSIYETITTFAQDAFNEAIQHSITSNIGVYNNRWTRDVSLASQNKEQIDIISFQKLFVRYCDYVARFNNTGNLFKHKKNNKDKFIEKLSDDGLIYPTIFDYMSNKELHALFQEL